MLELDMGGHVVPGSAYVEPDSEPGEWFVFAEVHDCDVYPDEVITWSIATSPHYEIALLIANAINEAAEF